MFNVVIDWKIIIAIGIVAMLPLIIFSAVIVISNSQEMMEYDHVVVNETQSTVIVNGDETITSHTEYADVPVTVADKYRSAFISLSVIWAMGFLMILFVVVMCGGINRV